MGRATARRGNGSQRATPVWSTPQGITKMQSSGSPALVAVPDDVFEDYTQILATVRPAKSSPRGHPARSVEG
jgi:hypothetical protein